MTGLNAVTLETLRPEEIRELAGSSGPCISAFLPEFRPGSATQSTAAILKMQCQEVERLFRARGVRAEEVTALLSPLRDLVDDPQFAEGSRWGRAIFRSPANFVYMSGLKDIPAGITVGGCFQIRPILAELHFPAKFYLLVLSEKHVEFLSCSDRHIENVGLPPGVPRSLDEALAFKPPDHDLENRSTAGSSIGSMRGVRFGTGSEREHARVYLAEFFKAVDQGIRELAHGGTIPMILAGVEADTTLYRSVASYPALVEEGINGSIKSPFAPDDLLARADAILRADGIRRAAESLSDWKERVAPERFSTDLNAILRAAVEGRVGWLFINETARVSGVFDGVSREGGADFGPEDLLNLAAVETILGRGSVYSLPAEAMLDGLSVAAVFRY